MGVVVGATLQQRPFHTAEARRSTLCTRSTHQLRMLQHRSFIPCGTAQWRPAMTLAQRLLSSSAHLLSGGSRHTIPSHTAAGPQQNPFCAIGYQEPFELEELKYSVQDLRHIVASLKAHAAGAQADINIDSSFPTHEMDPDRERISFLNSYRMSKAADYAWALKQNLSPTVLKDKQALKRFDYLENCMHIVNDHERPIVSVDLKIVRGSFREIGIAVYDPRVNVNSVFPNIKRIHIIAQEFFGVLSTTTFHGQSILLPSKEMVKFTRSFLQHYFKTPKGTPSAVLAGFNIPPKADTLKEACSQTPLHLDSLLDAYYIYTTPTLFRKDISTSGIMNSTSLQIILDRLKLPHSELANVGNRAYFSLIAILKLLNPYERLRFKLDDPMENVKFQEQRMMASLTNFMSASGPRRTMSGHVETGFNRPTTPITTASNFKEALDKIF